MLLTRHVLLNDSSESEDDVTNAVSLRLKRRILRDSDNPLQLPDREFLRRFRVNKQCFDYILNFLKLPEGQRSTHIPAVLRISVTLEVLASGGYQWLSGNDYIFPIAQGTVSKIVQETIKTMEENLCSQWIKFPFESEKTKEYFYTKYKIPGVLGCIDGTHVYLMKPSANEHMYYSRKGRHSINICDHMLRILAICPQYGGAAHDSFVWGQSNVKAALETKFNSGERNFWLLGDSGYPLEPWLMTPYRSNTEDPAIVRFNDVHSKARSIVERCIGIYKAVRYGRVPKRSRELNGTDEANIRVNTPGTPNTPTTPQMCSVASPSDLGCTSQLSTDADIPGTADLNVYDIIICVSQAHRSHCSYTEEQTRELVRRPVHLPQNNMAPSVSETLEQHKILLWHQYATRITPGVQRIVEFAKRVPGFCDFTQDDQLILIKLGFFEIWLSHVARMIADSSLTFDDGTYITKQQLEILYDNDFVIALLNFSNALNGYNLSDTEIGLFSAMVLLASDRPGITEVKVISRTRERIAEALRVQIVRSRAGSASALQLMPALEAKIPELRALGVKHCSHLDWLRTNWTKLRLPPLFAEIFDIPKTEDDL